MPEKISEFILTIGRHRKIEKKNVVENLIPAIRSYETYLAYKSDLSMLSISHSPPSTSLHVVGNDVLTLFYNMMDIEATTTVSADYQLIVDHAWPAVIKGFSKS